MSRILLAKLKLWLIIPVSVILLTGGNLLLAQPQTTTAAPEQQVYASPINAGCYQATRTTCKIHVDQFTINKSSGPALLGFQLYANASLVYDFKTDVSNPPKGNYTPSLVKQDFAVTCGQTYDVMLAAKDADNPNYYVLGVDYDVTCPMGEFDAFLPVITR